MRVKSAAVAPAPSPIPPAKPAKTAASASKISVKTNPAPAAKPASKVTSAAKPAPKAAKPAAKPIAKASQKPAAKAAPKTAKPAAKGANSSPKAEKPAVDAAVRPVKPVPAAGETAAKDARKPAAKSVEVAKSHAAQPTKEKINHGGKSESAAEVGEPVVKKSTPPPRRSSLVDFPVPPPPVRPPFVPPKSTTVPLDEVVPSGVNASHSPAFIQKQRARLLDLRDDLVDALSGMTRDTIRNAPEGSEASGSGMHQGDAGSDAYDRDFALSVLAKEQDALYEIDQALRRIQKGNYGVCEISNRKIPQARLEAIPFARLTVECQAQWEKEYGNRRFRPSNEVGFSGGNLIEDEDSEPVLLDDEEE